MARFPALPQVGIQEGIPINVATYLIASKEVIENLTGTRGNDDTTAVLRGDINMTVPETRTAAISAQAQAVANNAASVEAFSDLINDCYSMLEDIKSLRYTVAVLVEQLKGQ